MPFSILSPDNLLIAIIFAPQIIMDMKNKFLQILTLSLVISSPIVGNAQIGNSFKNLKEKVAGGGNSEGKSTESGEGKTKLSGEDKDRAAEKTNTFLDEKEYEKDMKGIGGVYYSTANVKALNDVQTGSKNLTKFLVEYIYQEKERVLQLKISNRYSYETTNRANLVAPMIYSVSGAPSEFSKVFEIAGHVHMNTKDYGTHQIKQRVYDYDLQRNIIPKGLEYKEIPGEAFVVEPGIIIIANSRSSYGKDVTLQTRIENEPLLVLYKPEKEEEALKYIGKDGYDKMKEINDKIDAAFTQLEKANVELMKPIPAFKDQPTNDKLVAAMKKRMADQGWKEELVYVYPGTEWKNEYQLLGLLAQNTLMRRVFTAQAVFKLNGKYKVCQVQFQQDNTYTTGSLEGNFAANPVYVLGVAALWECDEKKALQYKK